MVVLFLINTLITATEFAGIAAAAEIFHISRYIAVPVALLAVFFFVLRFNNKIVERVFVVFSLIYLTLHRLGRARQTRLARRSLHGTFVPTFEFHDSRLARDGRRADRHDDLALHAVLSAVAGRRERLAHRGLDASRAST